MSKILILEPIRDKLNLPFYNGLLIGLFIAYGLIELSFSFYKDSFFNWLLAVFSLILGAYFFYRSVKYGYLSKN
jgi:hypothetical protein